MFIRPVTIKKNGKLHGYWALVESYRTSLWPRQRVVSYLGQSERVQAHILVCFLAYVLWKTLAQMCKAAGLGDEPRRVFEELGKIRVVDVVLPARSGHSIHRRYISRPSDHQAMLLQRLGLNLPKNLPLDGKFLKAM